MYTAMDVYQAPQMKNWRNIIVDSLVRITASRCRHREFLRQSHDDMRPRRQDDVRILGLRRDAGARRSADHAADDRALLVAAEHPPQHGAGDGTRAYLGSVTSRNAAALVDRLEGINRALDGIRVATYTEARNGKCQCALATRIWCRLDVGDGAVHGGSGGNDDLTSGIFHIIDDPSRKRLPGLRRAR